MGLLNTLSLTLPSLALCSCLLPATMFTCFLRPCPHRSPVLGTNVPETEHL